MDETKPQFIQTDNSTSLLADIEALADRGLYCQALALGETHWGAFKHWHTPPQRLMAARLLRHLGANRTADALVLAAYRKAPLDPEVMFYFARYILTRRGPFAALQLLQKQALPPSITPAQQARWIALKAGVMVRYRDWDTAEKLLDDAARLDPGSDEIPYQRAWLLTEQDRYADALALLEPLLDTALAYCGTAMQVAHLYDVMGRHNDAIALLQKNLPVYESVDIAMQLYTLLLDDERLDEAEICVARVQALVPKDAAWVNDTIAQLRFHRHYQKGDYTAAIDDLSHMRSIYYRRVREHLAAHQTEGRQTLLEVPFIRQHHMTCAPATFAAIARFYGYPVDHLQLAGQICYDGTPALEERRWISQNGWFVREFELNLDDIITLIDAGCPVGLATVEPGSAHMQAIIGYDTRRGIYLLRDPFYPRTQELLIEGAHQYYASTGPRCMVFVPQEKQAWLAALPLRYADFYDKYYAVLDALDQHARAQAISEFEALQAVAPHHRLTLWARRAIAHYDNDSATALKLVDQLREQYPDDLNLMVAKSSLLGSLGKQRERLEFLEACQARGINHPYLLQDLADLLAEDQRRQQETRHLLTTILKRQPLSATALWTLAGTLWSQREHEQAFVLYRLCICIQDKVEAYASSYFKAARHLRKTDEALAFLNHRVKLLGARAPNAHITLARAYEMLGREQDGLQTLNEALQTHAEDPWLVCEAFDMLLSNGEVERASTLLQGAGHVISEVDRLTRLASIESYRGNKHQQLALLQQILSLSPTDFHSIARIASLTAETHSVAEAVQFLEEKLQFNPHNARLMQEKLQYVRQLPLDERGALLDAMAQFHPDNVSLLVARAQFANAQGDRTLALQLLDQAIAIDNDAAWLLIIKGDVLMTCQQVDQARAVFQRALTLAVDTEGVFERLLATHTDFIGKQFALRYIHEQLMQQVSFGNGILEFQEIARRYLPDTDVARFLDTAVTVRPDLWQSWIAKTRFLNETHHAGEALICANEAVYRFPLLPRVWLERAGVKHILNDIDGEIQDLHHALQINPFYTHATVNLVNALEYQGQWQAASEALHQGILRTPNHGPFYGYRADLEWRSGQRENAIASIEKALILMPTYHWAWDRLLEWCRAQNQPSRAETFAANQVEQYPHIGQLWKRCAEATTDITQKTQFIERALQCAPRDSDFLLARCGLFVQQEKIADARQLIRETFAGTTLPSEVATYDAWLVYQDGRHTEAIEQLETLLRQDPAHYGAWRHLARWYHSRGQKEDCLRCARQLVKLYPQSNPSLVAAAEYFIAHANGDTALLTEAREYLERALRIDHADSYTFLTLVDLYFEQNDIAAVERLYQLNIADDKDLFVQSRKLRLSLSIGDLDGALNTYETLLCDPNGTQWLVLEPLEWFRARKRHPQAAKLLQRLVKEERLSAIATRAWVKSLLTQSASPTRFLNRVKSAALPDDHWQQAMIQVFHCVKDFPEVTAYIERKLQARLRAHPATWTQLVYHAIDHSDWDRLRTLSEDTQTPTPRPTRAVYFTSIGWRATPEWSKARALCDYAKTLPKDDSWDNLMLWQQWDAWLHHRDSVDRQALANLDLNELTPLERFLFEMLQVLLESTYPLTQRGAWASLQSKIKPLYARHRSLNRLAPFYQCNQKLLQRMMADIQGPWWVRLVWYLRIRTTISP